MGRLDNQVKIRGHRIELEEVESVFLLSTMISHCVVLIKPAPSGGLQLVAYVTTRKEYNKLALKAYLKTKLPHYMIPSVIIELEVFPLTVNCKVDKNALPDPSTLIHVPFVAPRNSIEGKTSKDVEKAIESRAGKHPR